MACCNRITLVPGPTGATGPTGGVGQTGPEGPSVLNVNITNFVDTFYGSDVTGEPNNMARPYQTIAAAVAAATGASTTIHVQPGTYVETNLAGDGLKFYFEPNTTISPVDGIALFEDGGVAMHIIVGGYGNFLLNGTGTLINQTGLTSEICFTCQSLTINDTVFQSVANFSGVGNTFTSLDNIQSGMLGVPIFNVLAGGQVNIRCYNEIVTTSPIVLSAGLFLMTTEAIVSFLESGTLCMFTGTNASFGTIDCEYLLGAFINYGTSVLFNNQTTGGTLLVVIGYGTVKNGFSSIATTGISTFNVNTLIADAGLVYTNNVVGGGTLTINVETLNMTNTSTGGNTVSRFISAGIGSRVYANLNVIRVTGDIEFRIFTLADTLSNIYLGDVESVWGNNVVTGDTSNTTLRIDRYVSVGGGVVTQHCFDIIGDSVVNADFISAVNAQQSVIRCNGQSSSSTMSGYINHLIGNAFGFLAQGDAKVDVTLNTVEVTGSAVYHNVTTGPGSINFGTLTGNICLRINNVGGLRATGNNLISTATALATAIGITAGAVGQLNIVNVKYMRGSIFGVNMSSTARLNLSAQVLELPADAVGSYGINITGDSVLTAQINTVRTNIAAGTAAVALNAAASGTQVISLDVQNFISTNSIFTIANAGAALSVYKIFMRDAEFGTTANTLASQVTTNFTIEGTYVARSLNTLFDITGPVPTLTNRIRTKDLAIITSAAGNWITSANPLTIQNAGLINSTTALGAGIALQSAANEFVNPAFL